MIFVGTKHSKMNAESAYVWGAESISSETCETQENIAYLTTVILKLS